MWTGGEAMADYPLFRLEIFAADQSNALITEHAVTLMGRRGAARRQSHGDTGNNFLTFINESARHCI
jgi:hypothetical protein